MFDFDALLEGVDRKVDEPSAGVDLRAASLLISLSMMAALSKGVLGEGAAATAGSSSVDNFECTEPGPSSLVRRMSDSTGLLICSFAWVGQEGRQEEDARMPFPWRCYSGAQTKLDIRLSQPEPPPLTNPQPLQWLLRGI